MPLLRISTAAFLFAPFAAMMMDFAFMIEPIPMVTACVGTSSIFSKKREFALIVLSVRSVT